MVWTSSAADSSSLLKASNTSWGGYYIEIGTNSQTRTSSSNLVRTIRRNESLTNVSSTNNFNRATNKIVLKPSYQSYTHDVNSGTNGSFSYIKNLPGGYVETYSKSGDFGTDGSLLQKPDLASYNNAVSALGDIIRGGVDLSIDAFQISKTIELAKRILSVRKVVEYLAYKTWKDTSVQRRRSSKITRDRIYADKRHRFDRHKEMTRLRETPMKDVGSLYLEFTYGLKPTLQTIHDIVVGKTERAGNSLNIKKSGSRYNGATGDYLVTTTDSSRTSWSNQTTGYESSYRTKIGGTYQPGTSFVESLSRLTSLNPASIAWELLPFSFVVDWFYDIGGYLRMAETSLVSKLGKFDGYNTTTTRHSRTHVENRAGKDPVSQAVWTGTVRNSFYRQLKTRAVLTSIPMPRPPVFRCDLGATRMINAAALLSQFLGRK